VIPSRRTEGPRSAESLATSERRIALSTTGRPNSALKLQRKVGNRATAALLGAARTTKPSGAPVRIQRNGKSATLLTELAVPQIKPGPAVPVQKKLVDKLDVEHADEFKGGLLNLGGILIDTIPEKDEDLIEQAELVGFPTTGSFASAGGKSQGGKIKEAGFDRLVVENTLRTMIDARQIEYLRLAGLPNDQWKILIEVHYFRERDMSATGFHKDTLGETLFVNLNYAMNKKVIGPEFVINPPPSAEHDEQTAESLPEEFRKDLAVTRAKLGEPTEIGTGLVDPYGYVAFVDEAIHHATPHHWQRYVTGGELTSYLEATYPAQFKEARAAYAKYAARGMTGWLWWFSSYVDQGIISAADSSKWLAWMQIAAPILAADELQSDLQTRYPAQFSEARKAYKKYVSRGVTGWVFSFSSYIDQSIISLAESGKWLAWMQILAAADTTRARRLTRVDLKATMPGMQFEDLLEAVGGADKAPRSGGAAGGFHSASIPKASTLSPVRPTDKPPLKRRLSQGDFRKQLPAAPAVNEKRRFFRTWVRIVPAKKANELRRALETST
jgi:hypothetical protein